MTATPFNTGQNLRFTNGGHIFHDPATGGTPINALTSIVSGSLAIELPGNNKWDHLDQGVFVDKYEGDPRPAKLKFKCKFATPASVISAFNPAASSGVCVPFSLIVDWYTNPGGTKKSTRTFRKCYCPDGAKFSTAQGQDADEIEIEVECWDYSSAQVDS